MHLPLLESACDWENLCALFVIMELLNVLSGETYKCSSTLQTKLDNLNTNKKGKGTARSHAKAKQALDAELNSERAKDVNRLTEYQRMMFVTGRGLAQHSVNSLVDQTTGRSFREDVFVPMMASTLLHLRKGFELSVANDVDLFWRSLEVRQLFFQQLDSVVERHADVNDAYNTLIKETFDWEKADMKREYDIPSTGYQVDARRSSGTLVSLPTSNPLISPTGFTDDQAFMFGVSSRDAIWLEHVDMALSDDGDEGEQEVDSEDQ